MSTTNCSETFSRKQEKLLERYLFASIHLCFWPSLLICDIGIGNVRRLTKLGMKLNDSLAKITVEQKSTVIANGMVLTHALLPPQFPFLKITSSFKYSPVPTKFNCVFSFNVLI